MLDATVYEDDITKALEASIQNKHDKCEELQKKFYRLLDSHAAPIKDKIIDATLDGFASLGDQLSSTSRRLMDEMGNLKHCSEDLRQDIQYLETLKSRLESAHSLVSTIQDLRTCNTELGAALQKGDYEEATRLVMWYRSLVASQTPKDPAEGPIIASIKGLEKQLIQAVGHHFREGIVHRDTTSVSNYVKLFYRLNLHKEGILCYINFLRESISNECAANFRSLTSVHGINDLESHPGIYADVLSKLFHTVANLIQEHQQNVENQFGPETYLMFLRGLENETDIQALRILDKFESDYSLFLKYTMDTLPFTALKDCDMVLEELCLLSFRCQQFTRYLQAAGREIMPMRNASGTGTNTTETTGTSSSTGASNIYSPLHGLAMLSAVARRSQELMSSCVSLEHAYAARSLAKAVEGAEINLGSDDTSSTLPDDIFFILKKSITIDSLDNFALCAIINLLSGLLATDIRCSLENSAQRAARFYSEWLASNFAEVPIEQPKFSTALAVLAAQSEEPDRIADLSSIISRALGQEQQAVLAVKGACGAGLSWPHIVNDIAICCTYMTKLTDSIETEFESRWNAVIKMSEQQLTTAASHTKRNPITETHLAPPAVHKTPMGSDESSTRRFMFQQSLSGLEAANKDFDFTLRSLSKDAVTVMFQPVIVPAIHQFEALNLNIDQTTYTDYQINDPFMSCFLVKLTALLTHFQSIFCTSALDVILEDLAQHLAERFEELIFQKPVSLLGSVQLEGDIRSLVSLLNGIPGSTPLRHKFTRVIEATELLGVSSLEELRQLMDPLAVEKPWKFTMKEVERLVLNRVDFSADEIGKLFTDPAFAMEF